MLEYKPLRTIITVIALVLVVVHLIRPDIAIDTITLALLVAAVIPWLSPIIKSLEIPGLGKIELQVEKLTRQVQAVSGEAATASLKAEQAKEQVQVASDVAADANKKADKAATQVQVVSGAADSANRKVEEILASEAPPSSMPSDNQLSSSDADTILGQLARAYVDTRQTQRSGPKRTSTMSGLFAQMVKVAPSAKHFDVEKALLSADSGTRLAAYAFLYTQPELTHLSRLVDVVTQPNEDAFNQYWGIQAIRKVFLAAGQSTIQPHVVDKLRDYKNSLEPSSDRYYEINRTLSVLN